MKTTSLATVPLAVLLIALLALALSPAMRALPPMAVPAGGAQVIAGQFDPRDLCKAYQAAFTMAGVPNICDAAQKAIALEQHAANFGVAKFYDPTTGSLIARVDWGNDPAYLYKNQLPSEVVNSGRRVFTAGVWVEQSYTERGIGSAIVENMNALFKTVGAQSGDWRLVVASPARSMPQAAQDAWLNFIAQFCASNPDAVALSGGGIGCYMRIP